MGIPINCCILRFCPSPHPLPLLLILPLCAVFSRSRAFAKGKETAATQAKTFVVYGTELTYFTHSTFNTQNYIVYIFLLTLQFIIYPIKLFFYANLQLLEILTSVRDITHTKYTCSVKYGKQRLCYLRFQFVVLRFRRIISI